MSQVTRILHYLGDHILTLTRMNLRDYLQLKVQLEGTSGAGSSQVCTTQLAALAWCCLLMFEGGRMASLLLRVNVGWVRTL